jgi:HlyD family secretion protein/macrolide-specific efflux system membrane fusion protein
MSTPRKRRRIWPWVAGALVVIVAGGLVARRGSGGQKGIDSSLLVKVKRGDLEIAVIETGKVQPREKVEVKSKVAGQVEKVFVEEGQRVKAGQPLLRLDPTDFRREVARAEVDVLKAQSEIAQAKNGLEFAQLNLDRRKRGLEGRGVAQADVDVAQNEVRAKTVSVTAAQGLLAGARVALGAAQDRLRYTHLDAPMDGTVIQRGIEPGEVVTPGVQATFEGKALLTVADLSVLIVKADLNQIDVAKVKLGQTVSLTLDALPGKKYEARVTKVAPASTTPKGKDVDVFPVEATLTKADPAIKPGMTADVRIHIETKPKVLTLPIEAIAKEGAKSMATRLLAGGKGPPKTEKVEVQLGQRNDREVEVLSGIGEGDTILIKPGAAENEVKI